MTAPDLPTPTLPRWRTHALAAAAVCVGLSWLCVGLLWQKLDRIQSHLARQSADAGQQSLEAKAWAKQAQETVTDNSARLGLLEARVGEAVLQRSQLDELMQSVSRSRDDTVLMDVEISLRLAHQQAAHIGGTAPLQAALVSAQQRLKRSALPRLAPVLRAIEKDLLRLQTLQVLDATGVLLRLDEAIDAVDALVWANQDPKMRAQPAPVGAPPLQPSLWGEWGARTLRQLTDPLRDLVRITRVHAPEALLMTPEQGFYLRENIRLKLLHVRLRLLSRQHSAAHTELAQAVNAVRRHADPNAARTTQWLNEATQMQQQLQQAGELPRLDAPLAALEAIAAGK